jgi:carboxylesterase type B
MLAKLFLICATLTTLTAVYSTERRKVCIEQGELEGTTLTSRNGRTFAAFQGIPYAEPPVGNLRFKVRFKICFTFSHNRKYCDGEKKISQF